ncbi:MAG: amino acid permease [Streptococcaceae bacterium]|jgi:APA family basic amino acid/polyamine antiporter|nr:amino acid permease [Streptococcaceae bacterium]
MANRELKKEIGLFGALSTVVGTVIGGGVFFKISAMAQATGSANLALLAWIFSGIFTIAGGLTVAELATAIPKTGGAVKYLEHTYGKIWGFLFGWVQMLVYYPANTAALAIIWATQCINLFHLDRALLLPIAFLVTISVMLINLLGTKVATGTLSIFMILKLIPLALIVGFGLLSKGEVSISLIPITAGYHVSLVAGLGAAIVASMFAFDGWLGLGNVAGEMKRPERDLPRAIIVGLSAISVVYILVSYVFLKYLSIGEIAGNQNAASEVAQLIFGAQGGKLVTIGILISVYGAINGYTLTAIRVPYALALEGSLPFSRAFSKLNRFSIPTLSAIFTVFLSLIMMFLGTFDLLTNLAIFVTWTFSLLLFIAVFILRRREPSLVRPYKVVCYPVVPVIAIIGALYIMLSTLFQQTVLALIGIGITALGIPVFYYVKKHKD